MTGARGAAESGPAVAPAPDEAHVPVPARPAPEERGRALALRTDEEGWLGRLAGGVVHEIKNPLSTIHLNLELLRDEWARVWAHSNDPRERRSLKRIDVILRETRRLDAMLKDFLRFTRADRISREPVDLERLVEEVVAFVAPEFAVRRLELRREYDATAPSVDADPALVKQAILNLVQNAMDAMSAPTSTAGTNGLLTLRVIGDPDEVRIEVEDTGVGIAPDDLPRLFELYRTTKPDGTGLGLATTRRIIEAHGGRLEVRSEPGKGSRFIAALPRGGPARSSESQRATAAAADGPRGAHGGA